MNMQIGKFKVDKVSNSSAISSGENFQINWSNSKKMNEGFGTISGKRNTSSSSTHVIKNRNEA